MDAPAHVGCLIQVRIIGIIEAEQSEDSTTESNDRLLGVSVHSYDHENLHIIKDASKTRLDQLEEFFISYHKQRSKKFKVKGTGGSRKALEFLRTAIQARKKAKTK
jgi:inorganic pyrophosphatase